MARATHENQEHELIAHRYKYVKTIKLFREPFIIQQQQFDMTVM